MGRKGQPEMISTSAFAEKMAVNYRTALNWLRNGLVPGAIERELPSKNTYWEIPITAVQMEKPKPGRRKGSKQSEKRVARKASKKELSELEAPTNDQGNFRAQEMQWLSEHRSEYAGKWVVIEGDQLISHGLDARAAYQEARQAGVTVPFLVKVEPEDQLPFGGW